jgi:hypothetical protein|tara:strand:+ start:36 stop:707 length:672 start_codon:yes stop_codon:yes gene_type:complete
MNTINENKKENQIDIWDQTEESENFNGTMAGNQIISSGHVKLDKPSKTDWFMVTGKSANDLTKAWLVDVKVDIMDEKYLLLGPTEFKQKIVNAFKGAREVYLACFVTSSGKHGVWPVSVPRANKNGEINGYVQTAFVIMEKAQHAWTKLQSNQANRVYDGFVADAQNQEMMGQPKFALTQKEFRQKAFNDRVIEPNTYKNDPYVMRVLNSTVIDTGRTVDTNE